MCSCMSLCLIVTHSVIESGSNDKTNILNLFISYVRIELCSIMFHLFLLLFFCSKSENKNKLCSHFSNTRILVIFLTGNDDDIIIIIYYVEFYGFRSLIISIYTLCLLKKKVYLHYYHSIFIHSFDFVRLKLCVYAAALITI